MYSETHAGTPAPEHVRLMQPQKLEEPAAQIVTQPSIVPASAPPPTSSYAAKNAPTQGIAIARPVREDLPQGLQDRVLPLNVRQAIWEEHFVDCEIQKDAEPLQLQIPRNKASSLLIPELISRKGKRGRRFDYALPEAVDIVYEESTDQRFGFTLLYIGPKRREFPEAQATIMALRVAWATLLPWANLVNDGYNINVVKWTRWQTLNDNNMFGDKISDKDNVMSKATYYVKDMDNLHDEFDPGRTPHFSRLHEDQHRSKRAKVAAEGMAESESNNRDLRQDPHHYDVGKMLQMQWPSDSFRPSPMRAQVSGIDCLAILYRFLYAGISRGHWPSVDPGAADEALLQYFWANFGKREADVSCRDQLRQAALAQIQGTMPSASVDFAALCESPAMMETIWARCQFCFYGTVCSRLKGGFAWVRRPDMQNPTELASMGRLDWDPEEHPVLQDFMNQMRQITKEVPMENGSVSELMWMINEPLVVQIRLTVRRGVRMSLNDVHRFTAVSMRSGEFDPLVEGQTRLYTYNQAETHRYVLAAAVKTRNDASGTDYDTIRLFGMDGRERVPSNTDEIAGRETWTGNVDDALPSGETFLLFYRRAPESMLDCFFNKFRLADTRPLTTSVVRRLADDQVRWRGLGVYAPQPIRAYYLTGQRHP